MFAFTFLHRRDVSFNTKNLDSRAVYIASIQAEFDFQNFVRVVRDSGVTSTVSHAAAAAAAAFLGGKKQNASLFFSGGGALKVAILNTDNFLIGSDHVQPCDCLY